MITTLLFASLSLVEPNESLQAYYDLLPSSMRLVAGSPAGEHSLEFSYQLGELSGVKDYGEDSQLHLERYDLLEGSFVQIGNKRVQLFCTVLFAADYTQDAKTLDFMFLADQASCQSEEVTMRSSTSVSFNFLSKSPEKLSGAQINFHRTPFWAERVTTPEN